MVHLLRNAYEKREKHTLLTMYFLHEQRFAEHLNQPGYKATTYASHQNLRRNVEAYLAVSKRKYIDLREISVQFGRDSVSYLRTKKRLG